MKAVVKQRRGEGFVELTEVQEPRPQRDEVLLRVGSAGICGSDLNILHDLFPNYNVPVILGHEFSATVEEGGSGSGFSRGDRVACETAAYVCNDCEYCRTGLYNLCPRRKGFGYGVDGAFTKFICARRAILHKLPDEISTEEAALLEPASVAVNALTRNSRVNAGDSVVIIGPGPIGMMCLQLAKLLGGRVTVVGTERSRGRLKVADRLGASTMTDKELQDEIDRSGGSGDYDVSVIATGRPPAFETALNATRPTGRVVHIGESTETASFQLSTIERKNLTINGSFSHNWPCWERAISLVKSGQVVLAPLITHRMPLERWKEAFDAVESRAGMKVLIRP